MRCEHLSLPYPRSVLPISVRHCSHTHHCHREGLHPMHPPTSPKPFDTHREERAILCPFCGSTLASSGDHPCSHLLCTARYPDPRFQFAHCPDAFAQLLTTLSDRVAAIQHDILRDRHDRGEIEARLATAPVPVQALLVRLLNTPSDEVQLFIREYAATTVTWSDGWGAGALFFAPDAAPVRATIQSAVEEVLAWYDTSLAMYLDTRY